MALAAAAPGTNIAVVLLEIGGLLLLLGLLSKLAKRLRTSPVAFYLAVGVLLGLSPIDVQPQVVDVGAAIGVVLLLFFNRPCHDS